METTRVRRYGRYMVLFYNRISPHPVDYLKQIPEEALEFMMGLPYEALVRPFIIEKLKRGQSQRSIANAVQVCPSLVQRVSETMTESASISMQK